MAGSWYSASRDALAAAVDAYLAQVETVAPHRLRAVVVPHAALQYSGPVAAHAYAATDATGYGTIVLVGPSHFESFEGVSIWPRGEWETPFGPVAVDESFAEALMRASPAIHERASAHAREHSLEMQMPFLARLAPDVPIVPLVMGRQTRGTAEALGGALASVIRAETSSEASPGMASQARGPVLLVASSDLSHYEDARTASALDAVVIQHIEQLDPPGLMGALEREPRHACGGGPIVSVLSAARAIGASQARVLRYGDSGDITGDKSSVVGYLSAAVW